MTREELIGKLDQSKLLFHIPALWIQLQSLGERAKVVLVDTGADATNESLNGNLVSYKNFVDNSTDCSDWDDVSHGTRCAGIIAANGSGKYVGIAPECKVYIAKILNVKGEMRRQRLISALRSIPVDLPDVKTISLSAGLFTNDPELKEVVAALAENDISLVCAIGNVKDGRPNFPALYSGEYKNIIAVGSADLAGRRAAHSISNPAVVIHAPGENINAPHLAADASGPLSGTSFATPFVAGVVALIRSAKPQLSAQDIRRFIETTASNDNNVPVLNIRNLLTQI